MNEVNEKKINKLTKIKTENKIIKNRILIGEISYSFQKIIKKLLLKGNPNNKVESLSILISKNH